MQKIAFETRWTTEFKVHLKHSFAFIFVWINLLYGTSKKIYEMSIYLSNFPDRTDTEIIAREHQFSELCYVVLMKEKWK